MRFATFSLGGRVQAGVVSDAGLHPLADGMSVLQLVRAGLPEALAAGQQALGGPAVPLDPEDVRPAPAGPHRERGHRV